MIKYNVVIMSSDYKVDIIKTFLSHGDAAEFLLCLINKNFKGEKEPNYKVYYDSDDVFIVYTLGYFSKTFLAKYCIIEHNDLKEDKQSEKQEKY